MTAENFITDKVGIGFRSILASQIFAKEILPIDILEVCSENYMDIGGRRLRYLSMCKERWPILCHGLAGDFVGACDIDENYFKSLKKLLTFVDAKFYSDHLCFTVIDNKPIHDLIPIPYNDQYLESTTKRIKAIANILQMPILIENISSYMIMPETSMDEVVFINKVLQEANCYLLLDINNVYVNSQNFNFCPYGFIDNLNLARVRQIHMAGHYKKKDDLIIDTHGSEIAKQVYDLLSYTLKKLDQKVPIIIERDNNIPPLEDILAEVMTIKKLIRGSRQ